MDIKKCCNISYLDDSGLGRANLLVDKLNNFVETRNFLEGRTVLLISPQCWNHLPVSKHHYAAAAAVSGARVWFIEPPSRGWPGRIEVVPMSEGLSVVRHTIPAPLLTHFHVPRLFDAAVAPHARRLGRVTGTGGADIVWSFEPSLYADLSAFGGGVTVFHAADPFASARNLAVASGADLILGVSDQILALYEATGIPRVFINHGVSPPFEALARLRPPPRTPGPLRVGYAGNLDNPSFNRPVVEAILDAHPSITFHFWGPTADSGDNLSNWPNVTLNGSVAPGVLADALSGMDLLLLAYKTSASYDKSNSHKLLEYLSTGRPVVSSRLRQYVEIGDSLITFADDDNDDTLPGRFGWAVDNLDLLNEPGQVQRRQEFALEHTYSRQITRVAEAVSDVISMRC